MRDPSQTLTLRKRYAAAASGRFRALRRSINITVKEHDAFGLAPRQTFAAAPPGAFVFVRTADRVRAFVEWLAAEIDALILPDDAAWVEVFLMDAYLHGVNVATHRLATGGYPLPPPALGGPLAIPLHVDRLELLFTRNFELLKGITTATGQAMARELTGGFLAGETHLQIAKRLTDVIDTLSLPRARMIARTEIIATHAEATLNAFALVGLDQVQADIESEFITAGDLHVCKICAALNGQIFTIREARGVIPVHPLCRCAWLPVVPKIPLLVAA